MLIKVGYWSLSDTFLQGFNYATVVNSFFLVLSKYIRQNNFTHFSFAFLWELLFNNEIEKVLFRYQMSEFFKEVFASRVKIFQRIFFTLYFVWRNANFLDCIKFNTFLDEIDECKMFLSNILWSILNVIFHTTKLRFPSRFKKPWLAPFIFWIPSLFWTATQKLQSFISFLLSLLMIKATCWQLIYIVSQDLPLNLRLNSQSCNRTYLPK